jgi:hypothetical protein
MLDAKSTQGKFSQSLQSNKLAIFLELVIVLPPIYLGLVFSDNLGSNHISLGNAIDFGQSYRIWSGRCNWH